MPKVPIDYSQTCIYKLVHFDDINDENIYIGHTVNMVQRKHSHKSRCNNPNNKEHNHKKYQFIRENDGWDKWDMILVEKYPCNDLHEAKARERHWIKELKATLNVDIPTRTPKEYREDNKEYIKEWFKKYDQNPERKQKRKEKDYQIITCECGKNIKRHSLNYHIKSKKHQEWLKNNNLSTN